MRETDHIRRGMLPRSLPATLLCFAAGSWCTLGGSALLGKPPFSQRADDIVVIDGTLEAASGYPRVHVQLRQNNRVLSGQPTQLSALTQLRDLNDLDEVLAGGQLELSFGAFLDTGATAHVISKATAERFGIEAVSQAVYHETGLHGDTPMGVSRPYTLALSGSRGQLLDAPGEFRTVEGVAALLLNLKAPINPLIELAMGPIDVVGMPAIAKLVVEIDPAPAGGGAAEIIDGLEDLPGIELLGRLVDIGAGPAVRLHDPAFRPPDIDLEIPLYYVDYARRKNPRDRGPQPELAKNPTIQGIETKHGGRTFTGDWLLDTAAPASIISTEQALALGLYDPDGKPTRPPDFALPLGGVGGEVKRASGFRIERLRLKTVSGRTLEYRGVFVIVHDVSTPLDNGRLITLDGIFGTNLLLPTVAGLSLGLPTDVAAAPFRRIWIDGPRGRLLLELP